MYLLLSTIVHAANDSERIIPPDFYVKQFICRAVELTPSIRNPQLIYGVFSFRLKTGLPDLKVPDYDLE